MKRRRRPGGRKAGYHWIAGDTRAERERSLARLIGLARLVCRYEELGAEDLLRVVREFLGHGVLVVDPHETTSPPPEQRELAGKP